MGSVARTITKPFEWLGEKAGDIVSGVGGILTPQMPELPPLPQPAQTEVAAPAPPEKTAESSSKAQDERSRLRARVAKRTKTLLTGPAGVTELAQTARKTLLG